LSWPATSFPGLVSKLIPAPRSRTTFIISRPSISPPITRPATSKTPFICPAGSGCSALILPPSRST
jgi:hypothetical protein